MATETSNEKTSFVIKYTDDSSSRFSNVVNGANAMEIYSTAVVLNSLQESSKVIDEIRRINEYVIKEKEEDDV